MITVSKQKCFNTSDKRFLPLGLSLILALSLSNGRSLAAAENRTTTIVNSLQHLQEAVSEAEPGAVIVLADGAYDKATKLSGRGSKEKPIVVRSQTIGGAELRQPLSISGSYVTVMGFNFAANGSVHIEGRGHRVSRCRMSNVQSGQWVVIGLKGREIEIDHCLFENKQNNLMKDRGCQLLRAQVSNSKERHHIHHNHFRDIPKGKSGNGYETIQLITRGNPFNPKGGDCETIIEKNLFERCNGESEIISVKSSGNMIRQNTFRACRGGLVLRHGHRNVASENMFFGDDETGSSGIRLQGRDQVVANNVFAGLGRSAISMMDGTPDSLYVRVERARISHNSIIHCGGGLVVGMNHSKHPNGTPPKDCTVVGNLIVNDSTESASAIQYVKGDKPENWTWRNNVVHGELGIPPVKGIVVQDPHLKEHKNGLMVPTATTPTYQEPADELAGTKTDLFGKPRKEKITTGAIQFPLLDPTPGPLTAAQVGPEAGLQRERLK